jgi:hypothetical protein
MTNATVITCYTETLQSLADLTVPSHARLADHLGAKQKAALVPPEGVLWEKRFTPPRGVQGLARRSPSSGPINVSPDWSP